jgi:hypothetical protein
MKALFRFIITWVKITFWMSVLMASLFLLIVPYIIAMLSENMLWLGLYLPIISLLFTSIHEFPVFELPE